MSLQGASGAYRPSREAYTLGRSFAQNSKAPAVSTRKTAAVGPGKMRGQSVRDATAERPPTRSLLGRNVKASPGKPTWLVPLAVEERLDEIASRYATLRHSRRGSIAPPLVATVKSQEMSWPDTSMDAFHIREIEDGKANSDYPKIMEHFKKLSKEAILSYGNTVFEYFINRGCVGESEGVLIRLQAAAPQDLSIKEKLLSFYLTKRADKASDHYEKIKALPIEMHFHEDMFELYVGHYGWDKIWTQFMFMYENFKEEILDDETTPIAAHLLTLVSYCKRPTCHEYIGTVLDYCAKNKLVLDEDQLIALIKELADKEIAMRKLASQSKDPSTPKPKGISGPLIDALTYITKELFQKKRFRKSNKETFNQIAQDVMNPIIEAKDEDGYRALTAALPHLLAHRTIETKAPSLNLHHKQTTSSVCKQRVPLPRLYEYSSGSPLKPVMKGKEPRILV